MKKFKNIYIEITRACNLKCSFCPSKDYSNKDFITFDKFKHIIDEIKDHTDGIYLHILGEPLLHQDVFKFIEYASKYVKVSVTTNGHLINTTINQLVDANLYILNISLQSLVKFDEEKVENYFKHLNELIINRKSKLPIHLRIWNDKENEDAKIINDKINELIDKYQLLQHQYVNLSVADEFDWPSLSYPINEIKTDCLGGKYQLGVLLNGDVVLCCLDYLGHTKIGNIYENSFKEILSSESLKEVRKYWNNKEQYFELCKKCTYRNRFKKEH